MNFSVLVRKSQRKKLVQHVFFLVNLVKQGLKANSHHADTHGPIADSRPSTVHHFSDVPRPTNANTTR